MADYGDNIFAIGGAFQSAARRSNWAPEEIERVHRMARETRNYEAACRVYGEFITIDGLPALTSAGAEGERNG